MYGLGFCSRGFVNYSFLKSGNTYKVPRDPLGVGCRYAVGDRMLTNPGWGSLDNQTRGPDQPNLDAPKSPRADENVAEVDPSNGTRVRSG